MGKDKKDECFIDGRKATKQVRTIVGTKVKVCDAHDGKKK